VFESGVVFVFFSWGGVSCLVGGGLLVFWLFFFFFRGGSCRFVGVFWGVWGFVSLGFCGWLGVCWLGLCVGALWGGWGFVGGGLVFSSCFLGLGVGVLFVVVWGWVLGGLVGGWGGLRVGVLGWVVFFGCLGVWARLFGAWVFSFLGLVFGGWFVCVWGGGGEAGLGEWGVGEVGSPTVRGGGVLLLRRPS